MAYRYSNTDKWCDAWFATLKPIEKLLFLYLCDNCDIAGFAEINIKRWAIDIETSNDNIKGALKGLSRGLTYSNKGDCVYINNFLKNQKNLPLDPRKNPAHRGIVKRFNLYLNKFNSNDIDEFIKGASEGLGRGIGNGKGNSKDNYKDNIGEEIVKEVILSQDEKFILTIDEVWKPIVKKWTDYKRERKESYKSQTSLATMFKNLQKISENNPVRGAEIIDNSIANNYSGMYEPKNKNGKNYNGISQTSEIEFLDAIANGVVNAGK